MLDSESFPVLSGAVSKNSFEVEPTPACQMEWLRATSLNVLRDCPSQFYSKFCIGLPQPTTKGPDYAMIGTIMHEVIENFIVEGWEIGDSIMQEIEEQLLEHNIRENEIDFLKRYLNRCKPLREHSSLVEYEFERVLIPGYPAIRGHVDWICSPHDNLVVITDHKTYRQPKQLEKWIDDLQTKTYAWAVRELLKDLSFDVNNIEIMFRIGYVLIHYDAEWVSHPSFDTSLKSWYRQAWDSLLLEEQEGNVKRTACDTCKYCPNSTNGLATCEIERIGKQVNRNLLNVTLERFKL